MKNVRTRRLGTALLVAMALASSPAQAVVIDAFYTPQLLNVTPNGFDANQILAPEAVGGERDFEIQVDSSLADALISAQGNGEVFLRIFQAFASSETLTITYDGIDGSPAVDPVGLNGLDMTEGGTHDALLVNVNQVTANIDLVVRVYFGDGTSSATYRLDLPDTPPPLPVILGFGAAPESQVGTVDFSNVRALQFSVINSTTDFFLRLGIIGTFSTTGPPPPPPMVPAVPPPALAALAGGIVLAARAAGRRRGR